MYNLPLGIRIPKKDEYPKGYDVNEINKRRESANIVAGYKFNEINDEKYSYYVEINVDSEKLWEVFYTLSKNIISNTAYGIIAFKEEKPILSNFTSSENIIKIFEEYKFELTNDGYLEFGMAYYDDSVMNEIYVASYKYIKVWTTNIDLIDKTLNSFGIQQVDNLHFIDEFPVVSEALEANAKLGIKHYSEVFACINQQFDEL